MDSKENPHHTVESNRISRRKFLQLMAVLLTTGYLSVSALLDIHKAFIFASEPNKDNDANLRKKAEALRFLGLTTSFTEGGAFSNEMFETVRQSVFLFNYYEGKKLIGDATCWLCRVDKEKGDLYFATAAHTVGDNGFWESMLKKLSGENQELRVHMARPNIDTEIFQYPIMGVEISSGPDLAVFCVKDPTLAKRLTPLPYTDSYHLERGTKILVVGFPASFRGEDLLSSLTFAEEGNITTILPGGRTFNLDSEIKNSEGGSGSPIIVAQDGKLEVLGMLHSIGFPIFGGDTMLTCKSFQLEPLIQKLEQRLSV